ncbi:NACHT, LRR and PYD domains-containing protein 3-like isoform X2 [Halichondria panicea]|uniref:NACHT, LRR and PYD domains-containing protein 3-like isoform X2 n=1 Tax=Halichondria panicea TaxID=6063 RepID=UPI00312BB2BF
MDKFITSIRRKYRERLLNREEQWPPVSGEKLINLQLVEADKREGFRAGLPQHGAPDDKVKRTPILHGNLFKNKTCIKPVKKLIVEGNAGIGKTTLCTMLAEGWAEGKILTQFDCVLLLPLREHEVSSATSLAELFKLLHSSEEIRTSVIKELEDREGEGVLIIADGWDELSEENRSKFSFLYKLFFGGVLPFASVLLTSRPSASAPLHNLPSVNRLVEVIGFNDENIKQYIESEFEQFPEKASSLIEQLENNPVIQSVCSVPLNCAIVCNLWHTLEQELPRTLTELYTQIVLNIILRNVKKKVSDCPISLNSFDEIPNDLQDTFWLICEFAYECLLLDQLVFSEDDLSSRLPEVGDNLLCFGLLQSARSLLPVGHGLSFHFAHLTIQEFLAALHLATLPNEEKLKVVETNADSVRFDMVWRFMFGLASKYNGSHSDKVVSLDHGLMDQFVMAGKLKKLVLCHAAFEASDSGFCTKFCNLYGIHLLDGNFSTTFDCVAGFYVLRHAVNCDDMVIRISHCAIDDKPLKELTDILSNANGKLQVTQLSLQQTKLSDKGVADLFKRASAAFTDLHVLWLEHNNFTYVMSSFMHTSCTSLTQLDLSHNPLGVSGIQLLDTAVQSGALINLMLLWLANTLTDDADVNGALLTTLLQSIAPHCPDLVELHLSKNNLGLPGLCSVVENIPLRLNKIVLSATHLTTSFHSESQYTVTCEMLNINPNSLAVMDLSGSNFSGTAGTLLLAKFLQAFPYLECLHYCWDCSFTSADIIMLIHHLKSANVICKKLNTLYLNNNSIDDEGLIALTECLPELFPRLKEFNVSNLDGNPVSEELMLMCNEHLKTIRESRNSAVLTEWERTCLPPQNEEMNCTFHSLWDTLLSNMIDKAEEISSAVFDSILSWPTANEPAEYNQIVYEVVDTVDTPSDVTDPDTLINEQSFSQASPVEHHPTASDEATCTTALQSTHRTDQHTTSEASSDVNTGRKRDQLQYSGPSSPVMEPVCRTSDQYTISPQILLLGKPSSATGGTCTKTERKSDQQQYSINQCGTLANVVSSTGSGMSDQQPCLSNSVMEDVCLKTEVHDHDQHITSDKLSPAMEHVCIKKTVMSDQQLYTNTAADVTEGETSQDVLTSYPHTIPSGAGGPRTVTIEELKEHTKVTDSQLDTEIEKRDMLDLADHFDTVDTYAVQLGLSPAEQSDVRIAQLANGTQIAMDKALRLWRQHNPGAATYRALVEMLLRKGKEALAFEVCQSAAAKKPVQRKTCDVQ